MSLKKITPLDYDALVKKASPKSKWYKDVPKAFIIGGIICVIGEAIATIINENGVPKTQAYSWASIILIFISAALTAIGVYQKIAKHGGAGTLVPITGFANSVASAALEFKSEGLILGLGAKIFIIAGPVILYGTTASVIYGIIYFFTSK